MKKQKKKKKTSPGVNPQTPAVGKRLPGGPQAQGKVKKAKKRSRYQKHPPPVGHRPIKREETKKKRVGEKVVRPQTQTKYGRATTAKDPRLKRTFIKHPVQPKTA